MGPALQHLVAGARGASGHPALLISVRAMGRCRSLLTC